MNEDGNYDDDSDLTELSDDEEQVLTIHSPPPQQQQPLRASARSATKASTARIKNAGRVIPRLRPHRTTLYSTVQMHHMIRTNKINLNAEYQRDVVWNEHKQIQLIDSVMHNYYIPPIVFSFIINEDGSETRICIDGKQRLTAVQKFLDGLIPHKDHQTRRKLWYKNIGKQRHQLLSEAERDRFDTTQLNCVEYDNLKDEDEREIFQRVQLGMALSPAERMQAINSPNATIVRAVRNKLSLLGCDHKLDRYKDDVTATNSRGRYFQTIAQILYLISRDLSPTKVKPKLLEPNSTRIETLLNEPHAVSTAVQTALDGAMSTLCILVHDPVLGKPLTSGRHKLSPVEFVMLVFLLHLYRQTHSLVQLSDAVERMRKDVRSTHRDVRFNSVVYKHLLDFVIAVKGMKLKGEGEGVHAAKMRYTGPEESSPPISVSGPRTEMQTSASVKRKRADRDEDDGENVKSKHVKETAPPSAPLASSRSSKKTAPAPTLTLALSTSTSKLPPAKPQRTPSPLFTPISANTKRKRIALSDDDDNKIIQKRVQPKKSCVVGRGRGRGCMRVGSFELEDEQFEHDADDESGEDEEDGVVVVKNAPPKTPRTPAARASVKLKDVKGKGKEKEKESTGKTKVKRSSMSIAASTVTPTPKAAGGVKKPTKSSTSASTSKAYIASSSKNVPPPPSASTSTSKTLAVQPSTSEAPSTKSVSQTATSSGKAPASKKPLAPVASTPTSNASVPERHVQTHATPSSPPPPPPAAPPSTLPISTPICMPSMPSVPSQIQGQALFTPTSPEPVQTASTSTPTCNLFTSNASEHNSPVLSQVAVSSSVPTVHQTSPPLQSSPVLTPQGQVPASQLAPGSPPSRLRAYYALKERVRLEQEQRALQEQQEEARLVQEEQAQRIQQEQARRAQEEEAQRVQQEQARQAQEEHAERVQAQQQQAQAQTRVQQEQVQQSQVPRDQEQTRLQQRQLATNARRAAPPVPRLRQHVQSQFHSQPEQRLDAQPHNENDPEAMLHIQLDKIELLLQPQPTSPLTATGTNAGHATSADVNNVDATVVSGPPSHRSSHSQGQGQAPLRMETVQVDRQQTLSPLTSNTSYASPNISPNIPSRSLPLNGGTRLNPNSVNVNVHTNSERQLPSTQPHGLPPRPTPSLLASSSGSFHAASERQMSIDSSRYGHDGDSRGPSESYRDWPRDLEHSRGKGQGYHGRCVPRRSRGWSP